MPPVEFDTIPRFASHSAQDVKESFAPSELLELGSFEPISTRSKGHSMNDSGLIKDVEIPEIDSDDETTADKLMKDYSEEESEDDSDYVPSEDGEHDAEDDFIITPITRSKGISLEDSKLVQDVDVPELDSEDETTIDKIMKDYSDEEDVASDDDADYVPSEGSDDELEYDSDASISDDEFEHGVIEDVMVPKASFTTTKVVIKDVKIPEVSNLVIKDVHVGSDHVGSDHDSYSELASIANNAFVLAAGHPIIQAGIQTIDVGLDFCEKIISPISTPYKEHVQGVRRHLRAIRRSGSGPSKKGIFAFFIELLKVNWFLSFIGLTITVGTRTLGEKKCTGKKNNSQDLCDDEESTVYKLMKEYDSQDDEDYVPSDYSEDSMEFESDCSDDETIVDKIMKDYSETEDSDYAPSDESEEDEDSLEYDSDAEVSDDSDYDNSDVEDCSEDETLLEKIMNDYSEESDMDSDYVPDETVEDIQYDSDASITETEVSDASVTETEESESDEESEDEICDEVECETNEEEIVDELESQDSELENDEDEIESQDSQLDD